VLLNIKGGMANDALKGIVCTHKCTCTHTHALTHTHTDAARNLSSTAGVTDALEEALKEAFKRTDAEFAADGSASMVGSTAVVALVGSRKAWIANCGEWAVKSPCLCCWVVERRS
jgi:serine/threonine protein phosphatase PrpC